MSKARILSSLASSGFGANGQYLTSNGSALTWQYVSQIRQNFTANGSTNVFTVTGGYAANLLEVFVNGVKLVPSVDVDITNGSTFTILAGNPISGSVIEVVGISVIPTLPSYTTASDLSANLANYANNTTPLISTSISVGNSTVNTKIISTNISVGNSTVNTNISSTSLNIGTSFIANSTSIYDSYDSVRSIPQNSQTASYQLASSDNGKHVSTNAAITVNGAVLSTNQVFSIYNNSSSSITITQGSGATMYLAGTGTTGNRTLAQHGICTILMVASNTFVISGSGLS